MQRCVCDDTRDTTQNVGYGQRGVPFLEEGFTVEPVQQHTGSYVAAQGN